jgi:hypothetical protein
MDKMNQIDQHLEAMEVEASRAQEDEQNQVIFQSLFYFNNNHEIMPNKLIGTRHFKTCLLVYN